MTDCKCCDIVRIYMYVYDIRRGESERHVILTLRSDMLGREREREGDMIPSGLRPVEMLRLPLSCGGGQQLNTPLHVSRRVSLGGV